MKKLVLIFSVIAIIILILVIIGKKEIKTSIEIDAPPKFVWKVLTDFPEYKKWNPFITSIKGEFEVGNKVNVNAGGMEFSPKILVFEEYNEIRWIGRLLFRGIFDGEHSFEIIDNQNGTSTFRHEEKFNGILVGLAAGKLESETRPGFEGMNRKLKEIAEKIYTTDNNQYDD